MCVCVCVCVCMRVRGEERGCCGRRWFGCLGPTILQRTFHTLPRSRKQGALRGLTKGFSCLLPGGICVGTERIPLLARSRRAPYEPLWQVLGRDLPVSVEQVSLL